MFVSEGTTVPWLMACYSRFLSFLDHILTTGDRQDIDNSARVLIETSDVAFFADFAVQFTVDCTLSYKLL